MCQLTTLTRFGIIFYLFAFFPISLRRASPVPPNSEERRQGCLSPLRVIIPAGICQRSSIREFNMASTRTVQISLAVAAFGILAFIFGVVAENKKPPMGLATQGDGVVICQYPSDPSIIFGILACLSIPVTAIIGVVSIYFPYNGKSVPASALFKSTSLNVFYFIAAVITVLAQVLMMWATISEGRHRTHNVHHKLTTDCPTAKTGLFGGAAFLALDAALFWLICQMLTMNSRSDYLDYNDDPKGEYGQVVTTDFNNGSGGANNL